MNLKISDSFGFSIRGFVLKFLSFLLITVSAFSEIRIIHSLDEISTDGFSEKTLVMLDLDDVLIYPQDALMQNWRREWKPEGTRAWTTEEDTIAWMNIKFQIMDPSGPKFIDALNENGIPTIGFTSFAMDQGGIVESIPEWRSQHLKELGLNFKGEKEIIFSVQKGFIPPSFEKGVLYCGDFYNSPYAKSCTHWLAARCDLLRIISHPTHHGVGLRHNS